MKCQNCGFENKETATFCSKCGTRLERLAVQENHVSEAVTNESRVATKQQAHQQRWVVVGLIALAVLVFVVCFALGYVFG